MENNECITQVLINLQFLTLGMRRDFERSCHPFWIASSGHQKWNGITENQENREEKLYNFIISVVASDGLAPKGARPSVGTMMTMVVSGIFSGPVFKKVKHLPHNILYLSRFLGCRREWMKQNFGNIHRSILTGLRGPSGKVPRAASGLT